MKKFRINLANFVWNLVVIFKLLAIYKDASVDGIATVTTKVVSGIQKTQYVSLCYRNIITIIISKDIKLLKTYYSKW